MSARMVARRMTLADGTFTGVGPTHNTNACCTALIPVPFLLARLSSCVYFSQASFPWLLSVSFDRVCLPWLLASKSQCLRSPEMHPYLLSIVELARAMGQTSGRGQGRVKRKMWSERRASYSLVDFPPRRRRQGTVNMIRILSVASYSPPLPLEAHRGEMAPTQTNNMP